MFFMHSQKHQQELTDESKQKIRNIKSEIDNLHNKIMTHSSNAQIIEPVFKWAQCKNNVYLNLKFAHRLDAPGTLTIKDLKVNFENQSIVMSSFGLQASQLIHFKLNLNFLHDIDPEGSSYKLDSVGTMFINISKAFASSGTIWPYLTKSKQAYPIWYEMKNTYKEAMEEYAKVLEKAEELKDKEEQRQDKKLKKMQQQQKEKEEKMRQQMHDIKMKKDMERVKQEQEDKYNQELQAKLEHEREQDQQEGETQTQTEKITSNQQSDQQGGQQGEDAKNFNPNEIVVDNTFTTFNGKRIN